MIRRIPPSGPDPFYVRRRRDNYCPRGIPIEVCIRFEELTLEAVLVVPRYSADAVLHRIRWFFHIERAMREFKCNDNWTPYLARWFMDRNPRYASFFELRELKEGSNDYGYFAWLEIWNASMGRT